MARPKTLSPKVPPVAPGDRFGCWQIVALAGFKESRSCRNWLVTCRCDCGTVRTIYWTSLLSGRSVGCMKCRGRRFQKACPRSGHNYQRWKAMLDRCYNPKCRGYARYGGRGIAVCESWHQYENFARDMGEPPGEGAGLDRIDNDGPYSPENCRWATRAEQALNTSQNHRLTFRGRTQTAVEWARELGIKPSTLSARLRYGWPDERVLGEPVDSSKDRSIPRLHSFQGVSLTIAEWSARLGWDRQILDDRIRRGWPIERALTTPPRRWPTR